MKEIKDDDIMSEQDFFEIPLESFEFVIISCITSNFIKVNNEFAYTIDDVFEIMICPSFRINPIDFEFDYYPFIKNICENLVTNKELYRIELDGKDYYYYFRIGRKKDNLSNSILKKQDKGHEKKKQERKKHEKKS